PATWTGRTGTPSTRWSARAGTRGATPAAARRAAAPCSRAAPPVTGSGQLRDPTAEIVASVHRAPARVSRPGTESAVGYPDDARNPPLSPIGAQDPPLGIRTTERRRSSP